MNLVEKHYSMYSTEWPSRTWIASPVQYCTSDANSEPVPLLADMNMNSLQLVLFEIEVKSALNIPAVLLSCNPTVISSSCHAVIDRVMWSP